jgi:hypothetical protein
MLYTLKAPPFNAENLTENFGFAVPPPLVALLNAVCEGCGSAEAACERLDDVLGWWPAASISGAPCPDFLAAFAAATSAG